MSPAFLLASVAFLAASGLAAFTRVKPQGSWLLGLGGVVAAVLGLGSCLPYGQRGLLGLYTVTLAVIPLVAAYLDQEPLSPVASLLASAGALAAAFGLPDQVYRAPSPGLSPLALLLDHGMVGLAAGAAVVAAGRGWRARWPKAEGALAAAAGLLLLAAMPGLGVFTVGDGLGLLPGGDVPLLTRVSAGPGAGAGGGTVSVVQTHLLPVRVAIEGTTAGLAIAAFALALILVLSLLERANPGPPSRGLTILGVGVGGFLLLGVIALGFFPLPAIPPVPAAMVQGHLENAIPLEAGWRLVIRGWPTGPVQPTPLGSGLDLAALLTAGGLLLLWGARVKGGQGPVAPGPYVQITLVLTLAALLASTVTRAGLMLTPWGGDGRITALGMAAGVTALASLARRDDHLGLSAALSTVAAAMLLVAALLPGRSFLPPTFLDGLAPF